MLSITIRYTFSAGLLLLLSACSRDEQLQVRPLAFCINWQVPPGDVMDREVQVLFLAEKPELQAGDYFRYVTEGTSPKGEGALLSLQQTVRSRMPHTCGEVTTDKAQWLMVMSRQQGNGLHRWYSVAPLAVAQSVSFFYFIKQTPTLFISIAVDSTGIFGISQSFAE